MTNMISSIDVVGMYKRTSLLCCATSLIVFCTTYSVTTSDLPLMKADMRMTFYYVNMNALWHFS
jgi:hypothetical protein